MRARAIVSASAPGSSEASVRRALKKVKSRYLIHTAGEGKQKILIPLGPEKKSPLSQPKNGSRPN